MSLNVTMFAKRVVGVVMFIHSHLLTLSMIPKSSMYYITCKVVVKDNYLQMHIHTTRSAFHGRGA